MNTTRLLPLLAAAALASLAGCAPKNESWKPPAAEEPPNSALQVMKANDSFRAALEAENAGHPEEAIALYRESLEHYSDFGPAWHNLGILLMQKGNNRDAGQALRYACDLSPADPRPPYNLGVLWQSAGYGDEALKAYFMALERDPNYLPALRASIRLEMEQGKSGESTSGRIRNALLTETDPHWREYFQRQKILHDAAMGSGGTMIR